MTGSLLRWLAIIILPLALLATVGCGSKEKKKDNSGTPTAQPETRTCPGCQEKVIDKNIDTCPACDSPLDAAKKEAAPETKPADESGTPKARKCKGCGDLVKDKTISDCPGCDSPLGD